jgi:peptide/nickel transport system permease protein
LSIRQRDSVEAARAVAGSARRIILVHVLPNSLGPIVVSASLGMSTAILAESSLSFIGFGVQAPAPSWGQHEQRGDDPVANSASPGPRAGRGYRRVVFTFNFLGDGLNDALNPRRR